MAETWTLPGVIVSVHDGDTLTARLDLFRWPALSVTVVVRLDGINARELAEPGGVQAHDHLAGLAPAGAACVVTIVGEDKYGGRLDGRVLVAGVDVGAQMVADQYAAAWDGKGPKPVPPWPIPVAA